AQTAPPARMPVSIFPSSSRISLAVARTVALNEAVGGRRIAWRDRPLSHRRPPREPVPGLGRVSRRGAREPGGEIAGIERVACAAGVERNKVERRFDDAAVMQHAAS